TGSMADAGKMTALQSAANNLLDQLKGAAIKNGDVYVSIVPFAKDVNLGAGNYSATWGGWTDWNANNQTCVGDGGGGSSGPGSGSSGSASGCTAANHNSWNGCVTDRGNAGGPASGDYDTNVVKPKASNTATLFAAEQDNTCPQAVLGLSYDWTSMKSL